MKRRKFLSILGVGTAAVATGVALVPDKPLPKLAASIDPVQNGQVLMYSTAHGMMWINHKDWEFEQEFRRKQEARIFKLH